MALALVFGPWAAVGANTGWASLGAMGVPTWTNGTLVFHGEQGTLAVTPLSEDVVRIRFTQKAAFGRDHSYAVADRQPGTPAVKSEIGSSAATLSTPSLKVTVDYAPLRISFANAAGRTLMATIRPSRVSRAR